MFLGNGVKFKTFMGTAITSFFNSLKDFWSSTSTDRALLVSGIKEFITGLAETGKGMLVYAGEKIKQVVGAAIPALEKSWGFIVDKSKQLGGAIANAASSIKNKISSLNPMRWISGIKDKITGFISGAFDKVKSGFGKVLGFGKSMIGGAFGWAKNLLGVSLERKSFRAVIQIKNILSAINTIS